MVQMSWPISAMRSWKNILFLRLRDTFCDLKTSNWHRRYFKAISNFGAQMKILPIMIFVLQQSVIVMPQVVANSFQDRFILWIKIIKIAGLLIGQNGITM